MFQKHEITLFKLNSYKNMSSADIKREKTYILKTDPCKTKNESCL